MILNVSGRTDIVAFYTPWFINRYKEGFVDVRNPFNKKLVSRINFDNVDLIMFCTKNPNPIIPFLKEINKPMLFHITLTGYNIDIEPNVIDKKQVIEGIKKISEIIGSSNVVIRYDPILINDKYTIEYHKKALEKLCSMLDGYVDKIIISFIDDYKNVRKNYNVLRYKKLTSDDYKEIGTSFSNIVKKYNMTIQTCCEEQNLVDYGFIKGECISLELAKKLTGKDYKTWKARKSDKCKCACMVDIGEYNTCNHMCKYCYANFDEKQVLDNMKNHNPKSSLLIGTIQDDDIIKERVN